MEERSSLQVIFQQKKHGAMPVEAEIPVILADGYTINTSSVSFACHLRIWPFTAYMLADRGYDVWLGNARGNTYSRAHVNMTPADPDFWKFT